MWQIYVIVAEIFLQLLDLQKVEFLLFFLRPLILLPEGLVIVEMTTGKALFLFNNSSLSNIEIVLLSLRLNHVVDGEIEVTLGIETKVSFLPP